MERQLTVKVCTLMRELEVLGDGHLKLDFADLREVFQTAMAQQACQASEVGRFCYLLQARYCRAQENNPSSFPLFLSCAQ